MGPRYKDGAQTYIQVNIQISTHKQKINLKFFLKTVLEEKSYPALHPNFRAPPDVLKREKECVSYCLAPHHPASTGYILPPARTLGQLSLYCSIPLHSLNVCPLHFVSKAIHSIVLTLAPKTRTCALFALHRQQLRLNSTRDKRYICWIFK